MKLIYMNTKELAEVSEMMDVANFQYIVISAKLEVNIEDDKDDDGNIIELPQFLPPAETVYKKYLKKEKVTKKYIKAYKEYLEDPSVRSKMLIIVSAILSGHDVVLLCNMIESESEYLKILCDVLDETYDLPSCSGKEFIKKVSRGRVDELEITKKERKKIKKKYNDEKEVLMSNRDTKREVRVLSMRENLEKLSDEEFIKLAKKMEVKKKVLKSGNRNKIMKHMMRVSTNY